MRRALLATVAVLAAIVLQVTVLNNLPFPGGYSPNLVLVVVVAMALASGPLEGAVIGFAAGLAIDIAPPATDLLGQSALVFCLVGYGCGKLRPALERSAWLPVAAVALGAAAGEALYALVGLTFGDPDITVHAVRQVLPVAVFYDVLLSPFVLYAVARLGGYAQWGAGATSLLTGQELRPAGAWARVGMAGAAGAVRDTGTGRSPRLRAAAAHRADAWIGGGQGKPGQAGAWVDRRRPPRLRLRGGVAGSATGGPPARAGPARLLPEVQLRLAAPRRRDGMIATRRGTAGTAFSNGRAVTGSSTRLRGGSLSGGPSALSQQGRARKQRTTRLKLGSRRNRDAVVGGGRIASGTWSGPSRGARIGRGAFGGAATPGLVRTSSATFLARRQPGAPGPLRSGRGGGASPRFKRPSTRAPRATTKLAAPKFRRPISRLRRSTGGLGGGATPRFRQPGARLRGTGRGLLGWRRKRGLSIKGRGGPR